MRSAFDEFMDEWFYEEVLFGEGAVTRDKARIMDTINHDLAAKLVVQAQEAGLRVEAQYVDDIEDAIQPAIINVQMGSNETFPQSEWLTIEVYDDNNIKARLTDAVREHFQIRDGYLAFESLQAASDYLARLYAGITRTVAEAVATSSVVLPIMKLKVQANSHGLEATAIGNMLRVKRLPKPLQVEIRGAAVSVDGRLFPDLESAMGYLEPIYDDLESQI